MASRVIRRGTATAAGVWASALVGILGTVVAARMLGVEGFGLFAIAVAASGFVQLVFDLTVEEALVKYGFRYAAAGDWGRLRRLFSVALRVKAIGGLAGAVVLALLAPFADDIFGEEGLVAPMLVAALMPVVATPEAVAAAALFVRERYDVRAALLVVSMLLRLAALAVGASIGVVEAVAAVVVAQALSSAAVSAVALRVLRTWPAGRETTLGPERREVRRFVIHSSIGSAVVSMRALLPPVLLGLVSPASQVAYFRVAQAPQAGFANLSAPARLVLLTEQTRDFERGRLDRMWAFLERYVAGTAVFVLVAVPVFWWLMPDLVRLVFGEKYAAATDAARLILVAAAIQLVWGWTKSFPVTIGRPGLKIVTHSIELAVLVPLLLVFGAAWGATGAAAAVAVSTGVFALAWSVVLVRVRRDPPRPALGAPAAGEILAP
jgi:O-antigen/teichoic acid export membrane protein